MCIRLEHQNHGKDMAVDEISLIPDARLHCVRKGKKTCGFSLSGQMMNWRQLVAERMVQNPNHKLSRFWKATC
ncbi:unnamed protein product [Clavelina lepadiformis]|uniref:Uncharacterized protein n=1 Tax=Clavelina lepadiformis TaxID=159417 RepID=A0ABP0EVD5_CLALP